VQPYRLVVYFSGEKDARHEETLSLAKDVLHRIPVLLHMHDGCERIAVMAGAVKLFAVDCKGNTLPA